MRSRVSQLRRDVAAVARGLRGRHPAPLIERRGRARPAQVRASEQAARELRVARRVDETGDAVSLWLEDPSGRSIDVVPGQFFTLLVDVGGTIYRRAYSASGDCADRGRLRLTIKRVAGGVVSNHLNDNARAGDTIRVLGPSGDFTCAADPNASRHVVLVGGGSGITPLMAIATAIVRGEPGSRVTLLYGNRSEDQVIFTRELGSLAGEADGRLRIQHVLEKAPVGWPGATGRLDRETAAAELAAMDDADAYYVCGPEPMMDAVRAALRDRGVDPATIREEKFTSPQLRTAETLLPTEPQPATIRAAGQSHEVIVAPGQTLLDAGLAAGAPMKFSCAMGGCGACKVRLVSGDVAMEEPSCLSEAERASGHVLACCSRPTSPIDVEVE